MKNLHIKPRKRFDLGKPVGERSLFQDGDLLQLVGSLYIDPIKDVKEFFSSLLFYGFYCYTYNDLVIKLQRKNGIDVVNISQDTIEKLISLLVANRELSDLIKPLEKNEKEGIVKSASGLVGHSSALEVKIFAKNFHLMLCEYISGHQEETLLYEKDLGVISLKKLDNIIAEFHGMGTIELSLRSNLRPETEKAYEDPEQNEFFWQLMNSFPDYTKAFSGMGISILNGGKLIKKKKYKEVFERVENILDLRNRAELYKEAESGNLSAMKTVAGFDKSGDPLKAGNEKELPESEGLPDYLRDNKEIAIGSEMDNIDVDLSN